MINYLNFLITPLFTRINSVFWFDFVILMIILTILKLFQPKTNSPFELPKLPKLPTNTIENFEFKIDFYNCFHNIKLFCYYYVFAGISIILFHIIPLRYSILYFNVTLAFLLISIIMIKIPIVAKTRDPEVLYRRIQKRLRFLQQTAYLFVVILRVLQFIIIASYILIMTYFYFKLHITTETQLFKLIYTN